MAEDLLPIIRAFEVRCSVWHAFDTWTRRINLWWPLTNHSVSNNAMSVTVEPWHGGRIFETTGSGDEIAWGTVNTWEPPKCFAYLWFIGEKDASEATQVTITFTALEATRTRVRIRHDGWERAGPNGAEKRRCNEGGWDALEDALTQFMKEQSSNPGYARRSS